MYKKVGKLIHKGEVKSGTSKAGKPWVKMEFVIDLTTNDNYPKFGIFSTFKGGVVEFLQDTSYGTNIEVYFDIEGKKGTGQWEGRYFGNLSADHVEVVRDQEPIVHQAGDHRGYDQMEQMHGQQYQRANTSLDGDDDDPLPF